MFDEEKTIIGGFKEVIKTEKKKTNPCLIVLAGNSVGKMFKIEKAESIIGRSQTADIPIDDKSISRHHAKILIQNGKIFITDLGSTNGTFYNSIKIEGQVMINDGDKIQVGNTSILKLTFQDAIEENFQKQLYDSATKDPLTQIFNRRYFFEQINNELSFAKRHGSIMSCVLFDIDHFKNVNDTYGHPAGDFVLKKLALLIKKAVRTEDVFARYGGEEFILLLRNTDEKNSHLFAERLRKGIENLNFTFEEKRIPVTISLGISTYRDKNFETPEELVKRADEYLYKAKKNGRNRVISMLNDKS